MRSELEEIGKRMYLTWGLQLLQEEKYSEAIAHYQKCWLLAREMDIKAQQEFSVQSLIGMATASLMTGQAAAAEKYFIEAGSIPSNLKMSINVSLATSHIVSGKIQKGIGLFQSLASTGTGKESGGQNTSQDNDQPVVRASAWLGQGVTASARKDYQWSSKCFEEAVDLLKLASGSDNTENIGETLDIPVVILQLNGRALGLRLLLPRLNRITPSGQEQLEEALLLNRIVDGKKGIGSKECLDLINEYRNLCRNRLAIQNDRRSEVSYARNLKILADIFLEDGSDDIVDTDLAIDLAGESSALTGLRNGMALESTARAYTKKGDVQAADAWRAEASRLSQSTHQ